MQRLVVVMFLGVAVVGCSDDDGGPKTTPDTVLVETPAALSNQGRVRILFEARGNANGFFCTLDANAPVPCISPFEADVADGEHTFAVAAALNQNVDETPATHAWTVDTVAPDTALLLGPPALDNALTPTFTFESPDASATFECALDGAAFAACSSPHTVTVTDGMHTFTVRAKDPADNVDGSPATHPWTVDATAPDTEITGGPAAGATTAATGTFTFQSPDAEATFECAVDGGAFAACTSPRAFSLPDGMHTFEVRAKDTAGLVDPSPASRTWTVDAVAPSVTITSAPTNPSNDATPTFAFTSPDATATFQCQIEGVVGFMTCTSPWTAPTVADGSRTFRVTATDAVGNLGAPAAHAWVVDTVAPTVTLTTQPAALSNDPTPTVAFTTAGAPVSVQCAIDGGAFAACTSPFTSAALGDGMHTITVRATDAAGNAGSATTAPFAIDTAAPAVTFTSTPAALSNDGTPTVTFTTAGAPTVTQCRLDSGTFAACSGTFTTAASDGAHTISVRVADGAGNAAIATTPAFTIDTVAPTVAITAQPAAVSNDTTPTVTFTTGGNPTTTECRVDTGAFAACTSPFTSGALADGAHTITIRVTDAATNTSSATTNSFTIDTVAPTATITSQPAPLSNDSTPTVAFTSAGNPTTTQCRVDAGAFAACTSPFTATVADGAHTITIRVADGAGNASTATTNSFTVDTVAPTVEIATQPVGVTNDNTPTVTFTTGGNPTTTECRVDTGAFAACTSPFTSGALADGSHTITIRVTDAATNTASATTAAFTIDTVAPTVTITSAPPAQTRDNTPTVAFTTAGNPTSTQCQVDSGAFAACTSPFTSTALADGAHTITVRVTDAAGNAGQASAAFTVDTVAPTVTITAAPASLSNDNTPSVSFTTAGSPTTVECRVDTGTFVACTSPHTFGATADGNHTITVRATDAAGNQGTATTATFTIDTTPPVVAFTEQAPASWPVNYFDFRFSVSGQTSIACSLDGGAFAACTSPHTVTVAYNVAHNLRVQARDAAGNTTTVQSASWTPRPGLVLHYPWEQGSTDNTSLLRQRPSHSHDGSVAAVTPFVGGWAGSALGSGTPAHTYRGTRRPLGSAPDGAYSASFWFRSTNDQASGTIFSNLGATGGVRISFIRGTALTVQAAENGQSGSINAFLPYERWVNVAVRTTGPAKALEVFINGTYHGQIASLSGFNAGQSADLTVGTWTGVAVDDLRFYNRALTNSEMCSVAARGFLNVQGACVAMSPGFEIDFEGEVRDTGAWDLVIDGVQGFSFSAGTLGQLFTLGVTFDWGYIASTASFSVNVNNLPPSQGRSFTFSFVPGSVSGRLIDFTQQCAVGGPIDRCGISVGYLNNGTLRVFTGVLGTQVTTNITSAGGLQLNRFNNVVVTEQRDGQGVTQAVTVFVNGVKTTIPFGAGDIYKNVTSNVRLVQAVGLQVDEYEFWPADLAQSAEMLCENGSDGEFDPATSTCLLTAGP